MLEIAVRCMHSSNSDAQCGLTAGHEGPHMSLQEIDDSRRRNRSPTLEDIRKVVREEIRAALRHEGGHHE